jgi:hypothetical protein
MRENDFECLASTGVKSPVKANLAQLGDLPAMQAVMPVSLHNSTWGLCMAEQHMHARYMLERELEC